MKPKVSRKREIIKIRAQINDNETKNKQKTKTKTKQIKQNRSIKLAAGSLKKLIKLINIQLDFLKRKEK